MVPIILVFDGNVALKALCLKFIEAAFDVSSKFNDERAYEI